MSDRFRALRLSPALLTALGALCALTATAAAESIPVPADAPTALEATPAVPAVIAFVHRGALCVALQDAGGPRPATIDASGAGEAGTCSNGPMPVLGPSGIRALPGVLRDDHRIFLAVTGTDGAAVQLRRRGAAFGVAATSAPLPLPDGAAELRLSAARVATEIDGTDFRPDEIAVLDATGTVRRVIDHDPDLALLGGPFALSAPRVAQRGRTGGATWRLTTTPYQELAATPLEPDRHVSVVCASFDADRYERACDAGQAEEAVLDAHFEIACDATGNRAIVIARPAVRRVVAVLGDGRRVAVALRPLPGAAVAGTRIGAVVAGRVGLRGVVGYGAGGRRVARQDAGLPPVTGAVGCGTDAISTDDADLGVFDDGPPLARGAHAARVADDADGIAVCVAVDRAPRPPQDCRTPPVDPSEAFLRATATAEGHHLFGLVPAGVASARLLLDDDTSLSVPVTPIAAYAGRYASVLRAVEADVPAARTVLRQAFLDGRGRVLSQWVGPGNSALKAVAGLGRPGEQRETLHAARFVGVLKGEPATCLTLGPLRWTNECDVKTVFDRPPLVRVHADCATRRLIVVALLRRPSDRLTLRTARGGVVRPRTVALPSRVVSEGARAASVAVLRTGLRVLRVPGAKAVVLRLPSARAQCGYGVSITGSGAYPAVR